MKAIDARGLSCPEPVIRARFAINKLTPGTKLEVLVENMTSRENVCRTAHSLGCTVEVVDHKNWFSLIIEKP